MANIPSDRQAVTRPGNLADVVWYGYWLDLGRELKALEAAGSGGGIPEAPIDGQVYGRQSAAWTVVAGGGQPLDATLTALAAYNTTGFLTQTAADTFTGRTLAPGTGISIANPAGTAGNPSIAIDTAATLTWTGVHTFSNYTDILSITAPATPASGRIRLFAGTAKGLDALGWMNSLGVPFIAARDNLFYAKNSTGATLTKGTVVYISGASGGTPLIDKALADPPPTKLPAAGIVVANIVNNATGAVMTKGVLAMDTSAFTDGASLFLSATVAGGLTATMPAHPNVTQNIGVVEAAGVGNGSLLVNILGVNPHQYDGVNGVSWGIGDGTGTTKSLIYDNLAGLGSLSWNPTTTRTLTLPDATGTVALISDVALKADLASPTFTGDPKAPTPTAGDADTSIATTAFVAAAITASGGGNVTGPASATADNPAVYNGTTGKIIKEVAYSTFKTSLALVKGDVGLGNVDNTSDVNKPISTAQQTGLDAKQFGFDANLLINGSHDVSQQNGNSAVTITGASPYLTDQWFALTVTSTGTTTATRQQATVPPGFTNALQVTCTVADTSIAAGEILVVAQPVEGLRWAKLGWGAAGALPVAIGFWVFSATTGNYCCSIRNGASNRSYVHSFNIGVASTWQYVTFVIPGDTTGTWAKDNTLAAQLVFGLMAGTTFNAAAADTWSAGNFTSVAGAVNFMGTAARSFYFTGATVLPLPLGTTTSPLTAALSQLFQRDPIMELQRCQRYWLQWGGGTNNPTLFGMGGAAVATIVSLTFPCQMRIAPAVTKAGTWQVVNCGQPSFVATADMSYMSVTATAAGAFGCQPDSADDLVQFSSRM